MATEKAPTEGRKRKRWALAVAMGALLSIVLAAPAMAQGWRPVVQSCIRTAATQGCSTLSQFDGAWTIAISPDGKNAYVAAWDANALHVFDRNPTTGALTHKAGPAGCLSEAFVVGCADVAGLVQPDHILISSNGQHVYVTGWGGNVAAFTRNTSNGTLTQIGCISETGALPCDDGRSIGGVSAVFSPNQQQIYVSGQAGTLAVLDRVPATGALTQRAGPTGCFGGPPVNGCAPANGLSGVSRQIAMSADGENLYVPSATSGALLVFDRNAGTGALTQKPGTQGCIRPTATAGCAPVPQLGSLAMGAELDAGNNRLYVTNSTGLVTFNRAANGTLSLRNCINDAGSLGCANGAHVTDLLYLAISPDGEDVVAAHDFPSGGLTIFQRNTATGDLVRRPGRDGCMTHNGAARDGGASVANACQAHPGVGHDGQPVFAGNQQLYSPWYDDIGLFTAIASLLTLKRDFLPVCPNQSVAVPHNTAVAINLPCSDRNGDALAITVQAPGAGQLGTVDQVRKRVLYNPFGGFSGADSFKYFATAAGLRSALATVSLSVARPTGRGLDADRDGFFAGQDCNDNNAAIRPGAREIVGNTVDENCDGIAAPFPDITSAVGNNWSVLGKSLRATELIARRVPPGSRGQIRCSGRRCPFTRKTVRARRGSINFLKALKKKQRQWRAGQTIEVRITAPNFNGKLVRYALKANKVPKGKTFCLPQGTNRPVRSC